MSTTGTLLLVLVVYLFAAAYAYRRTFTALRQTTWADLRTTPVAALGRLALTVLMIAAGGVMVLAGSALIFDSGNIQHAVPIDGREFVQLLKDVVPGMISVVVGFLVLEASGRLNNGRGLRHG